MSTTASRIIKNTGWLYAKMGVTMFISLYTTRLILNGLGASDFGIYNIVAGVISMMGFLNAALAATTQRFMNYAEGEGEKDNIFSIFNVSVILHFFIACIVGIILLIFGYFLFDGILNIPADRITAAKVVYGSLIVSTVFYIMTVPYDAVLNAHENMRYYAIIGIIESILKLTVAYICLHSSHDKLIVYGILMSIIPLILLSVMRFYCYYHYEECHLNFRSYYSNTVAKQMINFAGWTFITTITSMITQYGIGLIVNMFFGVVVNAAHGIATQLSGMLMAFSSNAQKAFNPILTKSEGAQDRDRLIYISLFGCRISFFIFGFFSLPVILLMPDILSIWLKTVPEWTVIFCRLQLIRILIDQLVTSLISAINAEGHINGYSMMRSISYFLPVPLIYTFFLLGFPPYWLYIIWIVCWSIIGGIGTIYYSHTIVHILYSYYFKIVFRPCLVLVVISLIPYCTGVLVNLSDAYLVGLSIVQVLLFGAIGWAIILNQEERSTIITLVSKAIKK